jgi:hypothetical protein
VGSTKRKKKHDQGMKDRHEDEEHNVYTKANEQFIKAKQDESKILLIKNLTRIRKQDDASFDLTG